jgi:hypothetical protein
MLRKQNIISYLNFVHVLMAPKIISKLCLVSTNFVYTVKNANYSHFWKEKNIKQITFVSIKIVFKVIWLIYTKAATTPFNRPNEIWSSKFVLTNSNGIVAPTFQILSPIKCASSQSKMATLQKEKSNQMSCCKHHWKD